MNKIDSLIKSYEEITHDKATKQMKINSLIESGVQEEGVINFLMKMKNGVLTKMTLALDGADEESDVLITLRLLSTQEFTDINDVLSQKKYPTVWDFNKARAAKILACASKPYVCPEATTFANPPLSEQVFLSLPPMLLTMLITKYEAFERKYSPLIEDLTQQDMDELLKILDEMDEDGVAKGTPEKELVKKKLDMLNSLDFTAMCLMLISTHKKLKNLTQQTDQLFTQ